MLRACTQLTQFVFRIVPLSAAVAREVAMPPVAAVAVAAAVSVVGEYAGAAARGRPLSRLRIAVLLAGWLAAAVAVATTPAAAAGAGRHVVVPTAVAAYYLSAVAPVVADGVAAAAVATSVATFAATRAVLVTMPFAAIALVSLASHMWHVAAGAPLIALVTTAATGVAVVLAHTPLLPATIVAVAVAVPLHAMTRHTTHHVVA